ncbi:hypothetical protein LEP1GSC047_1651 [Leptospira inadai serovar Lyme str. 10]|uniref:Peptidase MA family protein n=2 Tax=Leptospira inadai serovar Lyme TaxID=293084 RepID=V6HAR5_9LEPT|nr:hypothetical protein [Leptospira inadai]EQA35538.1 hypothetical protein LEP1GSC047_1651 [Leptospira inadai serovar Lyme str. 10]PNV72597.1 hypothetical protein BES34_019140 [Leptospira inadai serovar Lyme]
MSYSGFRSAILLSTLLVCSYPILTEPIRIRSEEFTYVYLPDSDSIDGISARKVLLKFSELFSEILRREVDRLNVRRPKDASIFIADTPAIFQAYSGQPRYSAGFCSQNRLTLYFQRPDRLDHRGILEKTIRHEICHLLLPVRDKIDFHWLEESYCESIYPTNTEQSGSSDLVFPERWITFQKELNRSLTKGSVKERKVAYQKARRWGTWLLKKETEKGFRELLEIEVPAEKWKKLYALFLMDWKEYSP